MTSIQSSAHPLAFFTAGMASSFMSEILALLRERQIAYRDMSLVQDNRYTMSGSAVKGTMTGGALPVDLNVAIDAAKPVAPPDFPPDIIAKLESAQSVLGVDGGAGSSLASEQNRTLVDMGEQTCFLHAACRSELKTKVACNLQVAQSA